MNRRDRQIPEGMQDTLPGECARKRAIEGKLRALFAAHGFKEAKTPQIEYFDVFSGGVSGIEARRMWKTFDATGNILVVRPDNTTPMVRLAATKLQDAALPIRLCYVQDALEFPQHQDARFLEMTQAGVELMGEGSAEADAEIVALAIRSLLRAGLTSFQIDIGQIGFFKGLMQEAGLSEADSEELRGYVEQKNMLAIEFLLRQKAVGEHVKARIMRLPMLYGGEEVLAAAQEMSDSPLCRRAIDNLHAVMAALSDYGLSQYVSIDLGMVHAINYYTGMILRGITGNLGRPLLLGGRYDRLPSDFGRPMPAIGFGIDIKQLLIALERQGLSFETPVSDLLIGYKRGARAQAIAFAQEMREQGKCVEMCYERTSGEVAALGAQKGVRRTVYVDAQGVHEARLQNEQ